MSEGENSLEDCVSQGYYEIEIIGVLFCLKVMLA